MTTPQLLNRNTRNMPAWVTEANERIGPKPPPPPPNGSAVSSNGSTLKMPSLPPKTKNTPEPDYEIIEFSQQQYSNEPMKTTQIRVKTPDNKLKCTLCGSQNPWVTCAECAGQIFCASCDDMFHKHPKRKQHIRKAVEQGTPPIPPKAQAGAAPPVAPPRRSKRGLLTPFLGRKEQMLPPPSPTPSHKSIGAWRGPSVPATASGVSMNNRPLPEPPRPAPSEGGGSSRSGTPKSVFDTIQRPPSVQLERIKTKANATLDRMAQLQQRYRQQKASQLELNTSGSEQAAGAQRRQMSTSVFNLNTLPRRPLAETQPGGAWLANQRMQQAQSMAQLNCAGCQQQQQHPGNWSHHQHTHMHPDDWSQFGSQQQFNHSNLSLNVGANYLPQHQQHPHYPPPVFMTQRGMMPNMYPGAAGYPVMHPGVMGMPPTAASRATSRARYAASPTPSRKSLSMRRKRSSYVDDELTDDEDSDQDDRRSLVSNRSGMTSASRSHHQHHPHAQRQRRLSSASQLINHSANDELDGVEPRHGSRQHKMRDRRGSVAKSVQSEWLPERRDSTSGGGTLKRTPTEPPKTSRIYSDLESEGSGARALVQAKIQQKLQEADQQKAKRTDSRRKPEMKDENTQAAAVVPKTTQAAPPAKPEQSESEYEEVVEEVTASESEAEAPAETTATVEAEDDDLGPPPSTPDHEWECEFCTFVNEPNIKICAICCKTPSKPPEKPKVATKSPAKSQSRTEPTPAKSATPVVSSSQSEPKLVRKSSMKSTKSIELPNPALSATVSQTNPKPSSVSTTTSSSTTTSVVKKPTTAPKSTLKTSSENESDNSLAKGFIHKESVENIWNTLDESIQAQAEQVLKQAKKVSTGCGGTPPRELAPKEDPSRVAREMGTSPPPQSISTQTYDELPFHKQAEEPPVVQERFRTPEPAKMERQPYHRSSSQLAQENERYRSSNDVRYNSETVPSPVNTGQVTRRPNFISDLRSLQHQSSSPFDLPHESSTGYKHEPARDPEIEMHIILKELELYKFTVEELEAALKYCGPDMHPIQWLRENWHKLVQTVQSLSTKYGQERAENTIGTISQNEARDALRNSGGNVWQAVADCIQQRQQKYRKLAAKGNFLSEDIVNALTAHQGNVDQALLELNRTQLKPFLMRIWGSPNGVENESAAVDTKSDIHEFLNTHALDCLQMPNNEASPALANPFDTSYIDDSHSPAKSTYATPSPYQLEDSTLKNLEILIGNMEQNQAKQNQEVLRSIETMLETFKGKPDQEYETDPEVMRILTKSPISTLKSPDRSSDDVKNFVWQHIQDIVPNLVQQVEQELMEPPEEPAPSIATVVESLVQKEQTPPPEPSLDIMEELIKPNLREASIREELPPSFIYATEIANFKLEFDRAIERPHELEWEPDDLEDAEHIIYKSFMAPKIVAVPEEKRSVEDEQASKSEQEQQTKSSVSVTTEAFSVTPETVVQASSAIDDIPIGGVKAESIVQPQELAPHSLSEEPNETDNALLRNLSNAKESDLPQVSKETKTTPELDDRPSTSREASKRNKRSQLPRKGRSRDQSQKPSHRNRLPQTAEKTTPSKTDTSESLPSQELEASKVVEKAELTVEVADKKTEILNKDIAAERKEDPISITEDLVGQTEGTIESAQKEITSPEPMAQTLSKSMQIQQETRAATVAKEGTPELAITSERVQLVSEIAELAQNEEPGSPKVSNIDSTNIQVENEGTGQIPELAEPIQDAELPVSQVHSTNIADENEETDQNKVETEKSTENTEILVDTTATQVKSEQANPQRNRKRLSKIPVRTLSSNGVRIESPVISENLEKTISKSEQINLTMLEEATSEVADEPTPAVVVSPNETEEVFEDAAEFIADELRANEESHSESELYSLESEEHPPKSPDSEVLLVINTEEPPTGHINLEKTNSNATISSQSSHSEGDRVVLKEFIPSGDPAKQNLSELVEDTQRLIKQMRDEISIDDFESTDEEYSEDYSDEFDEGEEEEWYDSEGEEEGTYNEEHASYIEEASSGAGDLADGDEEYTEIEDIIEEDEDDYEEEAEADKPLSEVTVPLETVTSTLSVTPTNHHEPDAQEETDTETHVTLTNHNETEETEVVSSPEINETDIEEETETVSLTARQVDEKPQTSIAARNELEPAQEDGDQVEQPQLPAQTESLSVVPSIEFVVEPLPNAAQPQQLEEPTTLPLIPAPPIVDSESRPLEPPSEVVLEEPKKVTLKKTNTAIKEEPNTSKPLSSVGKTPKTSRSTVSKIPKPTNEPSTNPNPTSNPKKLPMRSKSFSAPMGISSVKRIQQEYLQKQSQLSTAGTGSRVPLKSSPTNKKSLNDAISKFNTKTTLDGPSTSAAAAVNALLKPRSQPRIPKKKYHETCFSDDDYETSATEEEEEEQPLKAELLKRKLSIPVFRAYPSVQEPVIEEPAVLARKYVEQQMVASIAEAQIAATLVSMKFQEDVALWAAKECSDLDQAISMLQQECELCMNVYPMNQIVSMLKCTHKCCKQCAKSYFTVQITDRSINDCSCPYCKLPELSNEVEHEDEHLEYFSNLDIFLKSILDNDVHELFQRKLRDRTLLQDPNFKWCIQCSSGFFARPKQKRLICPDCGSVTCAQCRKPWERQHEGTSCDAYLEWKRENDPELQAQGVQEHLATNGIDCPKCKFRYSLARGGCMHFTCTQCKFEFCYGCARPFMMGAKCNISPYCSKLGLHAHHPRNCLFYLRDKIPLQLQFLLKEHKVHFDTEPTQLPDEPSSSVQARALAHCPIPLQKETPQGLVDTVCNSDVPEKHAGMCRTHYVEYLAAKVAKANIDPLPIFDLTDCVQELRRRGIALPERGPWDTDEIYKTMCSEVIKQHIPLKSA